MIDPFSVSRVVEGDRVPWKFALEFDVEPRVIPVIRKLVAATARLEGASETDAFTIATAVNEVLSNSFRHGYGGTPGAVGIDLSYDGLRLEILIHDHGGPITDTPRIPASLPPAGTGSRGLYLVGQLTDEAEIIHPYHEGRGVAVRMVKFLR